MFDRISNGWALAKESFRVLMLDKELLVFPLISGIACILVLLSFALPLWSSGYIEGTMNEESGGVTHDPLAYVILFAFYLVNYFVIIFFNSALIACAIIRLRGGDPTVADGFRAAGSKLPQILLWALVCATVGLILRIIESRSKKAGAFVSGLLGMAWSIMTYFVVPVIVVEQAGPFNAVKRSLSILRKTWGEALVGNFGIGLIVGLAMLVALVPAVLGFLIGSVVSVVAGIVITVLLVITISLVSSTLDGILKGALYEFANEGRSTGPFDDQLLRNAFVQK